MLSQARFQSPDYVRDSERASTTQGSVVDVSNGMACHVFRVFIVLCTGFTVLGAIEYRGVLLRIETPFTSVTTIVIGFGTAAALLPLFLTEIWRLIMTFSTWVAENLRKTLNVAGSVDVKSESRNVRNSTKRAAKQAC